jgi:MFS family permease
VLRGVAIGCALVGGGFLYHAWEPFPFLAAALVTVAACGAPILLVREDGGHGRVFRGVHAYVATSWWLVRGDGGVRRFLLANAAFEGTFAAARTFVVLYVIVGLGESIAISSLVLAAVAGGYTVAAVVAGSLASRFGLADVILVAAAVYGGGYLLGGVPTEWQAWYLAPIFGVAIAGGLVMTLAWGLLYAVMPEQQRGTAAGLATTTKGLGLIVGPLTAGAAIDLFGYRTLWPICGAIVLSSLPLLAALRAADRRPAGEQAEAP